INLPFRASEVGLDHTRAVHPLSLLYLSEFVSQVVGEDFIFDNPFLFWTKAQMCRVLEELNVVDIGRMTTSCDRRPHKQTKECGQCSSCLLRRQAFAAAGLSDRTEYLVQKETGRSLHRLLERSHLPAMRFQINRLRHRLGQPDAWNNLARQHPSLLADLVARISNASGMAQEEISDQILSLLQTYTNEWMASDVRDIFDAEMDAIKKAPKRVETALVTLG
ncbi:MAG: 7-cyano-7-deazaguanine synthase, partial [Thermodesulfobacteriota bacterium]